MTSEADIPEAILIMKTEQEGSLSKQSSRTVDEFSPIGLERFKGGSSQPLETVEHSTEIECSGPKYTEPEAVISVIKSNIEMAEGESFLESTSATNVASEETRRAPEQNQALGVPNLVDHETVDEKGYKGNQDMDEAVEKMEKHDTLDVKESQSLNVVGEEISGMAIETSNGDGKEALLHASDLTAENLNEEAEMVTDALNKDTSMSKEEPLIQTELVETSLRVDEQVSEKSSDLVGEEKDPEANIPREKMEDEKESVTGDILEDKSISTIAASSSIQNSNDAISEIGEDGKDKLDGSSVSPATGRESIQEAGVEEGQTIGGTGVTSEQMKDLAQVHRQMLQPNNDVEVSSVTETEEACLQIEENPKIFSQVSEIQPEDIKQSPKEEQNEAFQGTAQNDSIACEEVKHGRERDQSSSENVDSFTLNEEEKTIKTSEKSMEENYEEDKPTHITDIAEKETSIEKIDADEEVGDIHVPHLSVDETTQVQGENPESISKLEPEEQVPELIASKEENKHIVNKLEANQSTESTKLEQASTAGVITLDYKRNSCEKDAEKNTEETKEEEKVDSSFLLPEEDLQSKDKDLPMEEVSEITNGMNIDSSEIIEFTERDNMENLKHDFVQQNEQVVEKQQIPLDLAAEENDTSSRENANTIEEELNKSLKNRLEGKDEEDKPTDTNEMEIDTDEKNQTAEVEHSKNNVGDIDVPHSLVDEKIQAESENLDSISNFEPEEQVHEGKGTNVEEDKHIGSKLKANQSTENKDLEQTSTEEITIELNTRTCENMETLDSIVDIDVKDAEKNIEETKREATLDSSFMLSEEGMHNRDKDLAMENVSESIAEKNVDNSKIIEAAKHDNMEDIVEHNEPVKEKLTKSLEMTSDQGNKTAASNENVDNFTFTEEKQSIRTLEESVEATDDEGKPIDTHVITEKDISIEKIDADEENQATDVEFSNKSVGDIHVPRSIVDETPQVEGENPENVSTLEPEEQVHELNRASKEEDMHIGNKLEANQRALEQTFTEGTTAMQLNTVTCENTEMLNSKGSLDIKDAEKNIKETKEEDCSTERTNINTKGDEDEEAIVNEYAPALALREECTMEEKAEISSPAEVEETERELIGEGKNSKQEEDVENNNKDAQMHPMITDRGEVTKEQIIGGDVTCLSPEPIEEGRTESQENENEEEKDTNEQIIEESFVKDRSLDLVQDGQINDFQDNKNESEKALEEELETVVEEETIQNEASQNNKNLEKTSDTTLVKQQESLQTASVNLAPMQATTKDESNEEKYFVTSLEKQEESTLAAKVNVDPMETEIDKGKSNIMVAGEDNNGLAEATETVKIAGANMEEVNAIKEELITGASDGDISRDVILEDSVYLQDDVKGTEKSKEEELETGAGKSISCFTSQNNQSPERIHSLVQEEESSQVHDVNTNPTEAITENKSQEEKVPVEDIDNDVPEVKETINSENETEKEEDSKEQVLKPGNSEARSPDFAGEPLVDVPHTENEAEKSKRETFQELENETVDESITDTPIQDNQGPERIFNTTLVEAEESLQVDNALADAKEESEKNIPRAVEYMEQNFQEDGRVEKLEALPNVTFEEVKENTSSKSDEIITSTEEETIQNPVEASEETTKREETNIPEDVTEDKTAKEEDIKTVPEVLKNNKTTASNENVDSFTFSEEKQSIRTLEESEEATDDDGKQTDTHGTTEKEIPIEKIDADEENQTADVEFSNKSVGDIHVPHSLVDETPQVEGENPENVSTLEPEEQVHELNRASKEEEKLIGNKLEANQRAEDTNLEQTLKEGTAEMQLNTIACENTEMLNSKGSIDVKDSEKNIKETMEEDCSTERTKINTTGNEDEEGIVNEYSPALALRTECTIDDKAEISSPAEVEETEQEPIGEGSSKRDDDVENNNKDAQLHPIITDRGGVAKEQITEGDVACLSPESTEEGRTESQGKENEEEDASEQIITESFVKDHSLDLVRDGQTNDFQDNKNESEKTLEEELETVVEVELIQNEASQNNKNLERTFDTTLVKQQESLQTASVNLATMQATTKDESNEEKYLVTSLEKQEESMMVAKVNDDPMETEIDKGKSNIMVASEDGNNGLAEATEAVKIAGANMEEVNAAKEELIKDGNDGDISRDVILEDSVYLQNDEKGTEKSKEEESETGAGESISCFTSQDNQSPGTSHSLVKREEISQAHDVNMNPTEAITENKSQEEKIHVEDRDNDVPEVKETIISENETEKEEDSKEHVLKQGNSEARSPDFAGEQPLVDVPHTEKEAEKSKQETFQESENETVDASITDKPSQDNQGPERISDTTLVEPEDSLQVDNEPVDDNKESEKKIPRTVEYMDQNLQEDDRVEKLEALSNVTSEEIKENTSSKSEEKITSTEEETIQNPVEASEETIKREETNILEVTEDKTAKVEDIKTLPEVLKDSKSTEGKNLELDSPNMLETTSAGNETRERELQDHDGMKVCSPESTETTPDNCKEDENLQSTKHDEKLECTSELVAEDESNVIPQTNLGQSEENSNTAQDHTWKFFEEQIIRQQFTEDEKETEEDIEPKTENQDHIDNIENQKEDTHATVFTDEVQNGEGKDDESENLKENVTENKKEGHAVSLDVETLDKVEASGPVSTQYLKRQNSEHKEAENTEKEIIALVEDPETKEVNTNQGVSDACSRHDAQSVRECLEREPEEKINADVDKAEAIVARQILEPRLENSQLDDKPAEAFTNTSDEKVLETTEPALHGDEVDSVQLEDTSPDLASQLSAFDRDEAKKECIIIEDSEANEVNKSQETGTTAKTETPEKILGEVEVGGEPVEVFVNTSDEKDLETSETSPHGDVVDSLKVGNTNTDSVSQLTNFDIVKEEKKSVTMEDPETSEESCAKETDDKLTVEELDAVESDEAMKTETPEMRSRELQLDDKDFIVTSDEGPLVTAEASLHGDEVDSMKLEEGSSHVVSQLSTCDHDKAEEESITVEDPQPNEVTGSQAFSDHALMPEDCDVKQAEETEAEKNQTAEKLDADKGDKTVRTVAHIEDERDEEMYSVVTDKKHDNALVEAKEESGRNKPIIIESMEQNLQEDDQVEKLEGLSTISSEETEENASSKTVEKITSTEEEIKQNPVEASEETTKWKKNLDDFTENKSAKEEMLETTSAGMETREQKELDGVKVCSPESTETETTPAYCREDKNLQLTKLDEKLECTSELVAEDESNVIPETNLGQSDENSNTAQDHTWKFFEEQIIRQHYTEGERETDEDIEPKSKNQDHIDNIENQKEDTDAIVFTDEVQNGEEKGGESENLKKSVTDEENKKEAHVVSLDVQTVDKVEVSSLLSTQDLKRQDSEQKEAENSEKEIITLEDPKTKEVHTNQGVPDECSKHEVQGVRESLERELEEKLNADADKAETIVGRHILEPRLEDSQLDDKQAEAFTSTPDEKVIETTELGLHGDQVDSVELEETSPDSVIQLSAFDHDEAEKECIIIKDSEANEVNRNQDDSDMHIKSEDPILKATDADESGKTARTEIPEKIWGEVQAGGEPIEVFVNTSDEKDLETSETSLNGDEVDTMKVGKTSTDLVTMEDPETSEESHVKKTDDKLTVEKLDAVEADETMNTEIPEMRFRESQLDDKPIEDFLVTSGERPPVTIETTEASEHGDEVDNMKLEEASSHVVSQLSTCHQDKREEESITVEDPEPNEVNGSQAFSDAALMPEDCVVKQAGESEAEKNQTAEKLDADEGDKTMRTGATETSMGEAQPSKKPADDLITTSDKRSLETIEITDTSVHSAKVDVVNPEETSFDSLSQPPVTDDENVKQGSPSVEIIHEDKVEESKISSGVAFESSNQSDEGRNESGKSLAAEKVYVNESSETGSAVAAETTSGEARSNEEHVQALEILSEERSLETIVTTEDRLPGKGDSLKLEETTSTFVSQFPSTDGKKAERVTPEVPGVNEGQETHTFSDVVYVSKDEATTEETSIMGAQLDDKPVKLCTSNPEKSSPEATKMSEASLQDEEIDNIKAEEKEKEKGSVAVNVDQTSEAVTDREASLEDAQLDDRVQKPLTTANGESSLGITGTAEASLQGEGGDRIKLEETTSNLVSQLPTFGSEDAEKENITEGTCDADKVEETKISSDSVNELKDHDGEESGKNLIVEKLNPDATSATVTDITRETGLEEDGQSLLDSKHANAIISSPDEKSPETIEALQKEVETMQLQDNSSNLSTNAEEDNLGSDAVLESEVGLKGIEGTGKILAVDKINNETAAGQIPTAEELEEQLQISTSAFPIYEQEQKGTIIVEKLEEEKMKEVDTLEDHSTTKAPAESGFQMEEDEKLKAATQGIKLSKDLQRNSPSAVSKGEGQPLDGTFRLERLKDEDEVKYVSSPSESEQIVELTRPSKQASIPKSEASEGSFESVTEVSGHEVFMKPEDAEVVEMICEVTKTDLTEGDQKTFEGSPTTNNEVLSEKVSDKEVIKGQQELNAEEVPGNKIDKVPQTITSYTQNEKLIEESKSHRTHENIEKGTETEDKVVVDSGMIPVKEETDKERFPDEPERKDGVGAAIKSNLEDQNDQTNSGNSEVEAALICEESGIEMPHGTVVDREVNEIIPNIDLKEQSSHSTAPRQIPEETLDETTEPMPATRKEDVPPKLRELNAATQELGNVTEVNSEVAGIEHGGQEQMTDLSEKATEGPILIDSNKMSLSDLLDRSKKETSQVAGHSTEQEEPTASQEEIKPQVTETVPVEGPKSDEEDGEEHEKTDTSSDAPVIVEASRDIDAKGAHKKSHGILSGVGSKVKHSISKVKKAITGKSSHPKTLSPK